MNFKYKIKLDFNFTMYLPLYKQLTNKTFLNNYSSKNILIKYISNIKKN